MHKSSILTASSTWPKTSVSLSTNPKPRSYSRQQILPRTRQSHHHNHLINHSSSPPITLLLYSWNWSRIDDCNSFLYNNILNERQYIQNSPTPLPVTSQIPPTSPTCSTTTLSLLWCNRAFSISFQNHATTASNSICCRDLPPLITVIQFIPEVLDGVEVRALCIPVTFFHTKLG